MTGDDRFYVAAILALFSVLMWFHGYAMGCAEMRERNQENEKC